MSMTDQARSYLALREMITALRQEHGEDVAWHIVHRAVQANMAGEKFYVHKVSKPQLKQILSSSKPGEIA